MCQRGKRDRFFFLGGGEGGGRGKRRHVHNSVVHGPEDILEEPGILEQAGMEHQCPWHRQGEQWHTNSPGNPTETS